MDNPFEVLNQRLYNIETILSKLKQQNLKPILPAVEERPKDVKEAAAFLKISPQKLYILTSKRLITFTKPNKKLLFFESDLLNYLNSGRHKTRKEIEAEVENHLGEIGKEKKWLAR